MPSRARDSPHALQPLGLELANALARDTKLGRHLSRSGWISAIEAVAPSDHVTTAARHHLKQPAHEDVVLLSNERRQGVGEPLVDEPLGQGLAGFVVKGSVQRSATMRDPPQCLQLDWIDAHRLRNLSIARLTTEAGSQPRLGAPQVSSTLPRAHRYPHRSRLVSQRAIDRFTHVPDGVGRELHAMALVVPSERAQHTDRALLDQIIQGNAIVAVSSGDAAHHRKLRSHEPFQCDRLARTCSSNDPPFPRAGVTIGDSVNTLIGCRDRHALGLP